METELTTEQKLKFVIPQNMESLKVLMSMAHWWPTFDRINDPDKKGQELNRGYIYVGREDNSNNTIIRTRSMDALRLVAANRCDIGLVGSDCVEEKPEWQVEVLKEFQIGRSLDCGQPRLDIIASLYSPVQELCDIEPGAIFLTERPRITRRFLQENGLETVIESDDEDPAFFRETLMKQHKVGVWVIQGTSPVQLELDDYGVMVNETGATILNYGLKVIAKICDIKTLLIVSRQAIRNETKRAKISRFMQDLESAYQEIEIWRKSLEGSKTAKERTI